MADGSGRLSAAVLPTLTSTGPLRWLLLSPTVQIPGSSPQDQRGGHRLGEGWGQHRRSGTLRKQQQDRTVRPPTPGPARQQRTEADLSGGQGGPRASPKGQGSGNSALQRVLLPSYVFHNKHVIFITRKNAKRSKQHGFKVLTRQLRGGEERGRLLPTRPAPLSARRARASAKAAAAPGLRPAALLTSLLSSSLHRPRGLHPGIAHIRAPPGTVTTTHSWQGAWEPG